MGANKDNNTWTNYWAFCKLSFAGRKEYRFSTVTIPVQIQESADIHLHDTSCILGSTDTEYIE